MDPFTLGVTAGAGFILGLIVGRIRKNVVLIPDQLRALAAHKAREILKTAHNMEKIENAVDQSRRAQQVLEKTEELIVLFNSR